MSRFQEADLSRVKTQEVRTRHSKVNVKDFARPVTPEMAALFDALPRILAGETLWEAVVATARASRANRPVLVMMGGHVVKTGCGPLLIQLMERGVVTALAMNGAAAIHDFEAARFGCTSEDVEAGLGTGTFGMAAETSREMNAITADAARGNLGLGEALGRALAEGEVPHREVSLLAAAHRLGIPATVHVALGTDILHQHADADGAAIGATSLRDFRILAAFLVGFQGGVALHLGSAVMLPEVFLKAFSVAANLGAELTGITTVNFDFLRHYRPRVNVVERPTAGGRGRGLEITGHHEILIPLFTAGVLRELASSPASMKRRWVALIGALFTAGSLVLAFRGIQLGAVLEILRDVQVLWAIPVVGATILSIWVRAYRWKVLLQPVQVVSVSATYSATMIGFMANNVLPMRLGELVRAYAMGRSGGVSKSSAFATIVVERAFDLLAVLLFLGVMLLRYSFAKWVAVAGYVALGACLGMFAGMALLWWKREPALRFLVPLLHRLPGGLAEQMEGWIRRFLDGLGILSRGHHVLWVTILSIFTWLAMALSFHYAGVAFRLDLPFEASLVLVVVCALAVMLPSGPGFVGTFEVGARYGLMLFAVPDNLALSYALFYHAVTFVAVTLLGLYHLWRVGFSLKSAVEGEAASPG